MYHGLRKALTSGVSKAVAKDARVSAVEEAYVRLEKSIGSLVWMLDNCEATWSAQAAFTKYLPIIASDIYSRSDTVAKDFISATTTLAGELAISSSNTAVFAPIRSELAALKERVKKLEAKKSEWLRMVGDKAYYDEKYTKLSASNQLDKGSDVEKEKRTLIKKAQTNDNLVKLSNSLALEFEACNYEKLVLADKVLLAVMSSQCNNARKADFVMVKEILDRHHNRDIPIPQRDDQLSTCLTGVRHRRRSSSSETSFQSGHSSVTGSTTAATNSSTNPSSGHGNINKTPSPPDYAVPNYAPPPKTKFKDYGTPPYSNQPYASPSTKSYTSSYPPPGTASSNYNNSSSSSSYGNPQPAATGHTAGPKHTRRKSNPQSLGSWNSSTAPDDLAMRLNDFNIDVNPPQNTGYSPTAPIASAPSAPPGLPLPPSSFTGLGGRPTIDMEFSTRPPY